MSVLIVVPYRPAVLIADVFTILEGLDENAVRYWVGGGWGVDALVGRQTREHRDLDLAVDEEQLEPCTKTLRGLGYEVESDWLPVRVEFVAREGWVDVHPVRFDASGNGVQAGPGNTAFEYPVEARQHGALEGRRLPCLSVERQIAFHAGYEPRPQDLHDLELLRSLAV